MVFDVLYFIAAFELLLYGYMVANREWLFSSYRWSAHIPEAEPYADVDYGYATEYET